MMKKTYTLLFAFTLSFILMNSCSKSSDTTTGGSCSLNVTFSSNIKRILDVNCNSCHAPGSGNAPALAKWTYDGSYSSAFNKRSEINSQVSLGLMPQTGPLPQLVKDSIACWVSKNAPN